MTHRYSQDYVNGALDAMQRAIQLVQEHPRDHEKVLLREWRHALMGAAVRGYDVERYDQAKPIVAVPAPEDQPAPPPPMRHVIPALLFGLCVFGALCATFY